MHENTLKSPGPDTSSAWHSFASGQARIELPQGTALDARRTYPTWRAQEEEGQILLLNPQGHVLGNEPWQEVAAFAYSCGDRQATIFLGIGPNGRQRLKLLTADGVIKDSRSFGGDTTSVEFDPALGQFLVAHGTHKYIMAIDLDSDTTFSKYKDAGYHKMWRDPAQPRRVIGARGAKEDLNVSLPQPLPSLVPVGLPYDLGNGALKVPDLDVPEKRARLHDDQFLRQVSPAIANAILESDSAKAIALDYIRLELEGSIKWEAFKKHTQLSDKLAGWENGWLAWTGFRLAEPTLGISKILCLPREIARWRETSAQSELDVANQAYEATHSRQMLAIMQFDPITWGLQQLGGRTLNVIGKVQELSKLLGPVEDPLSDDNVNQISMLSPLFREYCADLRDTLIDGGYFQRRGPLRDQFFPRPLLTARATDILDNAHTLNSATVPNKRERAHLILERIRDLSVMERDWSDIQKKIQSALVERVSLVGSLVYRAYYAQVPEAA